MGGDYNLLVSSLSSINPLGMLDRLFAKHNSPFLIFMKFIS